jgi:hypothetical protein
MVQTTNGAPDLVVSTGTNGNGAGRRLPGPAGDRQYVETLLSDEAHGIATTDVDKPRFQQDATDEGFTGVHDVVKSVDVWFEIEASRIEKEARAFAQQWADANLPNPNEHREQVLEPEQILAQRASELWQQWGTRVGVKLQDAVDAANSELVAHASSASAMLTELRASKEQLEATEKTIEEIKRTAATERPPVKYDPFFSMWVKWSLTVLLVLVEFVANQPVFRIVWPLPSVVNAGVADSIEELMTGGWFAGLRYTGLEVITHVEASLLALVIVILLFVMAKSLGTAVRPLVALRPADYPYASQTIRALHRQKWVLFVAALLGTVFILAFLWSSRDKAAVVTEERLARATVVADSAKARLDRSIAEGGEEVGVAAGEHASALEERNRLEEMLSFARTVKGNNGGILVLNLSLVCFAFVVGFMSDKKDLTEALGEHPDLPRLKEKCTALRHTMYRAADRARAEVHQAEVEVARVRSLLRARPLATIRAKEARLASIIPLWRAENARLRRLDPSLISAFGAPASLVLPRLADEPTLAQPISLEQQVEQLERLEAEITAAVLPLELRSEGTTA